MQRRCIRERADDGQQQIIDRRIPIEALGCNDYIHATGKIQPHLDVIVIRQQRIIQHPMRGVKVHVVGQGENQRRIADSFPNLVDAGIALVGHDHHHIGFIIHEHHRPDFVLHLHRAPFRIGERHLPRAA